MSAATMNEMERLRRERDEALARLYVMRVKLHEAFMMPVSVAPGSAEAEELQDLRDLIGEAGSQFDTEAGIDRLKAEWQAEALRTIIDEWKREVLTVSLPAHISCREAELHRQAEGGANGHN